MIVSWRSSEAFASSLPVWAQMEHSPFLDDIAFLLYHNHVNKINLGREGFTLVQCIRTQKS
jgi:hypothetical protein